MVTLQKKDSTLSGLMYNSNDTYDEKANKTLGLIALDGPKTIYDLHKQIGLPLSTSQRIIRDLLSDNEIREVKREKHVSGTIKKYYGITAIGLAQLIRFDFNPVMNSFNQIIEMWWEDHGLIKRSEILKGDVPKALMQLFRVLGSITDLRDTFDEIGVQLEIEPKRSNKERNTGISSDSSLILAFWMAFLLPKTKANFKMLHRIYHLSPAIAREIDSYFERLSTQYKSIRKS